MSIMMVRMSPSAREAGEEACGKVQVLRAPLGSAHYAREQIRSLGKM